MTFKSLAVFVYLPDETVAVPAGILEMNELGAELNGASFAYGTRYIARKNAVVIDPVALNFKAHQDMIGGTHLFPLLGLSNFGAIRDASPDSWGRRVIEARRKVPLNSLPESEYLLAAGSNRVGAIDVRPTTNDKENIGVASNIIQLEYFMEAARRIEEGLPIPDTLKEYYDAGTALGGARPKASIMDDAGKLWMAKFPSANDPYDIPTIEMATLKLAHAAGLSVPKLDVRRFGSKTIMLIERFDRIGTGDSMTRRHFVSALTLLGCHEHESQHKNYADIADAFRRYGAAGKIKPDLEELFARMVFNILVSNDDDHLRNHGFLWNESHSGWELSPLYDVVPKPSLSFDRYLHLGIGNQGRLATLTNAMSWAARFGLTNERSNHVIESVWKIVREWKERFEDYGVPIKDIEKVSPAFRHVRDIGWKG